MKSGQGCFNAICKLYITMIITYEIGSLAAELKLTALSSQHGQVIHEGLVWHLEEAHARTSAEPFVHDSDDAQALFSVVEGDYVLSATFKGNRHELGEFSLKKNTCTDCVFVFNEGVIESGDEYFVEFDDVFDHERRQAERDAQSVHGAATLPLRDPRDKPQGEMGQQIMGHPLLQDSVQFDGVPPDMRPDPSENEAAMQLTLAAQLQNAPGQNATSTPSPTR